MIRVSSNFISKFARSHLWHVRFDRLPLAEINSTSVGQFNIISMSCMRCRICMWSVISVCVCECIKRNEVCVFLVTRWSMFKFIDCMQIFRFRLDDNRIIYTHDATTKKKKKKKTKMKTRDARNCAAATPFSSFHSKTSLNTVESKRMSASTLTFFDHRNDECDNENIIWHFSIEMRQKWVEEKEEMAESTNTKKPTFKHKSLAKHATKRECERAQTSAFHLNANAFLFHILFPVFIVIFRND